MKNITFYTTVELIQQKRPSQVKQCEEKSFPHQHCVSVSQVTDHLRAKFEQRKSPNKLTVKMVLEAKPWLGDTKHPLYEAGKRAVKRGQHHVITSSPHIITSSHRRLITSLDHCIVTSSLHTFQHDTDPLLILMM